VNLCARQECARQKVSVCMPRGPLRTKTTPLPHSLTLSTSLALSLTLSHSFALSSTDARWYTPNVYICIHTYIYIHINTLPPFCMKNGHFVCVMLYISFCVCYVAYAILCVLCCVLQENLLVDLHKMTPSYTKSDLLCQFLYVILFMPLRVCHCVFVKRMSSEKRTFSWQIHNDIHWMSSLHVIQCLNVFSSCHTMWLCVCQENALWGGFR